jgi:hypothetical protein
MSKQNLIAALHGDVAANFYAAPQSANGSDEFARFNISAHKTMH